MAEVGYRRDASWRNRPNTRTPKKIHRESTAEPGMPACGVVAVLNLDRPITTEPGDPHRCRRCWPAGTTDTERAEVLADVLRDRAMTTDTEGSKP